MNVCGLSTFLATATVGTRAVMTAAIVVGAILVGAGTGWLVARRSADQFARYYAQRVVHFAAGFVAVVALAVVWRPFAGRIGLVLGLAAAGLAFAMQEVIGALAGWTAILTGRIYRIGDRVEVGGVRGDVLDITPLRTKLLEIGDATEAHSWVVGRQPTGRIVSVSNKKTLTDPVFNYSGELEFVWEELTIPVRFGDKWAEAATIMEEEAQRASADTADDALREFMQRYAVRRADVTPRVFSRATDDYLELSARFPVSVRTARVVKDDMTRRIVERFAANGIEVASTTQDVTVRAPAVE